MCAPQSDKIESMIKYDLKKAYHGQPKGLYWHNWLSFSALGLPLTIQKFYLPTVRLELPKKEKKLELRLSSWIKA